MSSYKRNQARHIHISEHFKGCAFEPPLESYIDDVDEYIEKILSNAERLESWEDKELAGLVAVYCNDFKTHEAFITMVSVMTKYSGKGIAKELLNRTIEYCKSIDFKKIKLEVRKDNSRAIKIYEKFGFREYEQREKTIMMEFSL